jgi:hypothetical protein
MIFKKNNLNLMLKNLIKKLILFLNLILFLFNLFNLDVFFYRRILYGGIDLCLAYSQFGNIIGF